MNRSDLVKKMRMMSPAIWFCVIALSLIGACFIHSASCVRTDPELQKLWLGHLEVGALGLALSVILSFINYRNWISWSGVVYIVALVLLVFVPFVGTEIMGARRWLYGIQPSEIAKLAVILMLARLLGKKKEPRGVSVFLVTSLLVILPSGLILLQPDLGTAMVLAPTFLAMLFAAHVAPKTVGAFVLIGLLGAGALLGTIYYAEKADISQDKKEMLLKATCLRPHQIRRLQVFLFPDKDLHGSGYNRRQSEIAVGSGGFWGKGLGKGEQYTLGYLPPSVSSNDFIFSVLAEEAGFAGSLTVLFLYLVLLWSGLKVAFKCQDDTGRLICIGVMTLVFSHAFINIAMTIGVMPITGLPLPFISYGRTFMLTLMLAFGLIQSVSIYGREPETRF